MTYLCKRLRVLLHRYCVQCRQCNVTALVDIRAADGGMSRAFASVVREQVDAYFVHEACPAKGGNAGVVIGLRGDEEKALAARWGLRRESQVLMFK